MPLHDLTGRCLAVLVADGASVYEVNAAKALFGEAGAVVHVVSPTTGSIGRVLTLTPAGAEDLIPVDVPSESVAAGQYDAVFVPSGASSDDYLATDEASREFVLGTLSADRPVAFYGDAVNVAVAWGIARGRLIAGSPTAEPAGQTDLRYGNEPIVIENHLLTSTSDASLENFLRRLMQEIDATPRLASTQGTLVEESEIPGQLGKAKAPHSIAR